MNGQMIKWSGDQVAGSSSVKYKYYLDTVHALIKVLLVPSIFWLTLRRKCEKKFHQTLEQMSANANKF